MVHGRMFAVALAIAIVIAALSTTAFAQNRVALVIGNNAYLKVAPLSNAVNDAGAMAGELSRLGFQVIRVFDAKAADLQEATRRFISAVGNGGIGVVYFAGHGVQVEGRNFLLPVDFAGGSAAELGRDGVSVPNLLDEIDRAKPRLAVVILDACRNNPFRPASTAAPATRGLSEIARPVPTGTLVLYAASSNQTALDGLPNQPATNGLFTGELLKAMREPGLEIRDLAQKVRYAVMEKAQTVGHLQVPALYDNLSPGAFFFSALRSPPPASARVVALPARIRLIVPFAQRGPSDEVVRALVPFLSKALGRPIDVENQTDIQGDEVTARLAAGPNDGSLLAVSPYAAAARRLKANDPRLTPLGILVDTPLSLVVSDKHSAKSLPELLAAARAARRPLRMTTGVPGSAIELCAQQLQKKAGGNLIALAPVNGEGPAVAEVANGAADLTCASTAPLRRMAAQPNARIREIAEVQWTAGANAAKSGRSTGAQGFDVIAPNWLGLFAPAGLSAEARQHISAALARVQQDPAVAQALARLHALPVSADQATPDGLVRALRLAISLQN